MSLAVYPLPLYFNIVYCSFFLSRLLEFKAGIQIDFQNDDSKEA